MQKEDTKSTSTAATCMACSCEIHKEHNHPVSGEAKSEAKVCPMCGHEHKADGSCDCGCK